VAVSAFFFCGAMIFSAVGLNSPLRRIFNLTALLMLLVCFLVVKRFLATAYSYAVYTGESDVLLIFEHTLADKEPLVVGRIALSGITDIRVMTRKKKRKEKLAVAGKFYDYTVSVLERRYLVVSFDGEDAVKLTHDERLLEILENNRI
jgi:hypothetical protein